ncbi:MAG TPA: hypothetical protein VF116_11985 [Ktedonobacterales bacterium]
MADASEGAERSKRSAQSTLCVVAYGVTDRRTAGRLARAGLATDVVEPAALAAPRAGTVYLVPADRVGAEVVCEAASLGAHMCLMPPWSAAADALPGGVGALAPAQNRSGIRLAPALEQARPSGTARNAPARALRILYREQLVGALGQPLAQTATGEVLLAAMPRASNRHGQVVATTLLVGTPSAQTDLEDVVVVLRGLLGWLERMPLDRASAGTRRQEGATAGGCQGPDPVVGDERWAQIALLALALALPGALDGDDETVALGSDERAAVRTAFDALARRLGQPAAEEVFERGVRELRSLGVVGEVSGATFVSVRPPALRAYLDRWQLAARLRRLRPSQPGGE